jgi:hypothetical protein
MLSKTCKSQNAIKSNYPFLVQVHRYYKFFELTNFYTQLERTKWKELKKEQVYRNIFVGNHSLFPV